MNKNTNKKDGISGKGMMAAAAGAAAIGAGAYYLLGPNAKVHQKKAKALFDKMKKEVKREINKVKEVTPPLYHKAVDVVSRNYAKQYKLHEKDIKAFGKKLKDEWRDVSDQAAKTVKKSKSAVKKVVKK
ncbi:MAG TPA: hypothetical protein VJH06_01890 [Candidatus Paceibacterota bacterium]